MGRKCNKRHTIVLKVIRICLLILQRICNFYYVTCSVQPKLCKHSCINCGCVYGTCDVNIWLGTVSDSIDWIPNGCRKTSDEQLQIAVNSRFQCNLYVHQAKIRPIMDKTKNVCNAKLVATLNHLQGSTTIRNDTFSPIWNEVITFNGLLLPGTPSSYKFNPPKISMDLFDKMVHIGCCFLKPSVRQLDSDEFGDGAVNQANVLYEINSSHVAIGNKSLNNVENISNWPRALEWIELSKNGQFFANLLVAAELIQV